MSIIIHISFYKPTFSQTLGACVLRQQCWWWWWRYSVASIIQCCKIRQLSFTTRLIFGKCIWVFLVWLKWNMLCSGTYIRLSYKQIQDLIQANQGSHTEQFRLSYRPSQAFIQKPLFFILEIVSGRQSYDFLETHLKIKEIK